MLSNRNSAYRRLFCFFFRLGFVDTDSSTYYLLLCIFKSILPKLIPVIKQQLEALT